MVISIITWDLTPTCKTVWWLKVCPQAQVSEIWPRCLSLCLLISRNTIIPLVACGHWTVWTVIDLIPSASLCLCLRCCWAFVRNFLDLHLNVLGLMYDWVCCWTHECFAFLLFIPHQSSSISTADVFFYFSVICVKVHI